MFYLTNRDYATLILDTGTILLIAGIMYVCLRHRKKDRPDEDSFLALMIINIIIAFGDAMGYTMEEKVLPYTYILSTLGMTIFYIGFCLISMVWMHYTRVRFCGAKKIKGKRILYEYLPGIAMIILVLLNVFTGWIFAYDKQVMYHRGVLFIPLYIVVASYIVAGFVYISKYRNKDIGKQRIHTGVYALPIIFGSVFTFLVPGSASFAPIGIAMSIVFTHMGTTGEEA